MNKVTFQKSRIQEQYKIHWIFLMHNSSTKKNSGIPWKLGYFCEKKKKLKITGFFHEKTKNRAIRIYRIYRIPAFVAFISQGDNFGEASKYDWNILPVKSTNGWPLKINLWILTYFWRWGDLPTKLTNERKNYFLLKYLFSNILASNISSIHDYFCKYALRLIHSSRWDNRFWNYVGLKCRRLSQKQPPVFYEKVFLKIF